MKRRKIVKGVTRLLIFAILLSGCNKGEFVDRTVTSKSKELNWVIAGFINFETEKAVSEGAIENLNQLLVEKGKDYQIKFHFLTFQNGQLSKEDEKILKESDLITIKNQIIAKNEIKYYKTQLECVEKKLFEPLDEYMNSENGRKIKERMLSGLTLESGYWGGKQWLLPTELPKFVGSSLKINRELYEKCDLEQDTVPDFIECDELFEKIYQVNNKRPFLVFSDRGKKTGVSGIPEEMPSYLKNMLSWGGSFYQGDVLGAGVLNSAENGLDIRNLLKEPYFEEYLNAWKRYIEKGYVYSDMNGKPLIEICDSIAPEMIILDDRDFNGEEWVVPKAQNYTLYLRKQPVSYPGIGIGAESKQKNLAFEAITDMVIDEDLNEAVQNFGTAVASGFIFHTGLTEEGEKEYQKLLESGPQSISEYAYDTFTVPEIEEINKVYVEYSTDEGDDSAQMVLERHFSKDGKVTEQSIHEGIQRLNEKLDEAGMERFIEALKEQKLKSKK